MRTNLLIWTVGAAILGSLFQCSARECVTVLLALWTILIGSFVYSNLKERLLYIPVLLAAVGVLGSILILAIPGNVTLIANVAAVVSFVASLEVLKKKRCSSTAFAKHRT